MPGPVFLEGEAVDLRTIEEEDLAFMQEAVNDPSVWRGIGYPKPVNMEQEREFFEEQVCNDDWVNLLVATDAETPVGTVGFTRIDLDRDKGELGYWIAPAHQNEGYGTEAVELLVDYGFEQRAFHRIEARVTEFNDPSRRLLESVGFAHEGTLRENEFVDGEYRNTRWYGLLRDEWQERRGERD